MKMAIGCDDAAFDLKELIKRHLIEKGLDVTDFGTYDTQPVNYPTIAFAVAESIVRGESERAVLLCGTGIGMAISANKVSGIRAAQCHDTYSAERAIRSNEDDRIFPYHHKSAGTAFTRACHDLGIEDFHFHDLRHEGTSRLFEAGFAIEQVALVTGHKDWKMLRRYTHLKPESLHAMAASRAA